MGPEASCAFVSRDGRADPPTTGDLAYVPMTQGYDGADSGALGPASTAGRGEGVDGESYSPGPRPQPAFPSPFAVRLPAACRNSDNHVHASVLMAITPKRPNRCRCP